MLVTHHLLRKTPPSSGLTVRLQSMCEPRRRDRLPEEAMSEGARQARPFTSLSLRLSDQRRPTLPVEAGPERADEEGGPDAGATRKGLRYGDGPRRVGNNRGCERVFSGCTTSSIGSGRRLSTSRPTRASSS